MKSFRAEVCRYQTKPAAEADNDKLRFAILIPHIMRKPNLIIVLLFI